MRGPPPVYFYFEKESSVGCGQDLFREQGFCHQTVIYDVLFVRPCGDVDRLCYICIPVEINVEN